MCEEIIKIKGNTKNLTEEWAMDKQSQKKNEW